MKKNVNPITEVFYPEDFYCIRSKSPLSDELVRHMAEMTDSPYCKNRVPVLHLGEGNNDLLVIGRKKFVTLINKLIDEHDPQRLLVKMANREGR